MRRKMRINPFIFGLLVVGIFFGTIFGFQAAGTWSVSGKVDSSGKSIQPSAEDVSTIKGWMTLDQIIASYGVTLEEIVTAFNLPSDTSATTAIKDLESDTFDVTLLGEWLESGAPIDNTAVITVEGPIQTPVAATPDGLLTATPSATEHLVTDKTITGNTTFQNLMDWGLSTETIRVIIGGEIPSLSTKIKDYAIGKGVEFSTMKTQLQAEVDKLK
jgi:hypothetical protein